MRAVVERMMPELAVGGEEMHGQWARVEGEDTSLHWFVGYRDDLAFALVAEVDPAVSLWQPYAVRGAEAFLTGLLTDAGTEEQSPPEVPLPEGAAGVIRGRTGPNTDPIGAWARRATFRGSVCVLHGDWVRDMGVAEPAKRRLGTSSRGRFKAFLGVGQTLPTAPVSGVDHLLSPHSRGFLPLGGKFSATSKKNPPTGNELGAHCVESVRVIGASVHSLACQPFGDGWP